MKSLLCLAFGFWCGMNYTAIMTVACPASRQFPWSLLKLEQVTAVDWLCEPYQKEVKQ